MKKLLHIIATPREEESRTLQVSEVFLEVFQESHPNWVVDVLNLGKEELPTMNMKRADGKYAILDGKELYGNFKEAWLEIVQHIDRFRSADLFLISCPMWNFSIPYMLKQYIDLIVQPKYLFRYTKSGVEGLVKGKKMVLILSRGGQYTGELEGYDFQEPYLRTIFGFVGITDIDCIKAEAMDMGGPEIKRKKIEEAQNIARNLAKEI